ncbi:MAG TPA: serine/threonine-protein kinase [Gaiellaceae bacterium]|nr:serine/threonine-protein kinase [Gaiellaceae bacterium]
MTRAVRVAGRYELVRPLGHGAMAVVDLARDLELDRLVALKRLAENLARDDELRRRFLREARLAARLAHPNVVRVFDVGQDGGRPFIAMEYVEGETLAELLARRGPLPPAEVAALGLQACHALAAAHAAGLVHRDVKPQNLLLGRDGTLRLGDFGIAAGHDGTRLTVAGTVLGTAGYLAPEQARGEQVTAAADLYALGAVLYELLRGEPPRRAASLAALATGSGPAPQEVARRLRGAPAELVAAIADCLAPQPDERPPSAAALARRLAPVAAEGETLALPEDPAQRATQILAPRPALRRRSPARRLAAAGALAAAAAAGLAAALLTAGGPAAHPPGSSAGRVVAPPATGSSAIVEARNLAAWLRRYGARTRSPQR